MFYVWWLTPVILATQKARIRRIVVQGQLEQKFSKTPVSTNKIWRRWYMLSFKLLGKHK
jgi:hypothetical protein